MKKVLQRVFASSAKTTAVNALIMLQIRKRTRRVLTCLQNVDGQGVPGGLQLFPVTYENWRTHLYGPYEGF